jgi:hypothetical protein
MNRLAIAEILVMHITDKRVFEINDGRIIGYKTEE